MAVRGAKHILRGILFETEVTQLAPTVAHFLNCFLGAFVGKKNLKKKKKKKKVKSNLSPEGLWVM
jgi:hypothetical protein